MNNLTGIITTAVIICFFANPAWAGITVTAAAGEETTGYLLSTSENGGGQARINYLLDRFAGVGFLDPFSEDSYNPTLAIVPSISETSLLSAFTRAGSTMNAYYSRFGSDNKENITVISRSTIFAAALAGDRFVLPDAGLAAVVQGHFVGSGAVASGADVVPIQATASNPSVIQNSTGNCMKGEQGVPIPLPFLLTGSGLAALMMLKKWAGLENLQVKQNC
jgi:hypothetical protein